MCELDHELAWILCSTGSLAAGQKVFTIYSQQFPVSFLHKRYRVRSKAQALYQSHHANIIGRPNYLPHYALSRDLLEYCESEQDLVVVAVAGFAAGAVSGGCSGPSVWLHCSLAAIGIR